MPATLLKRRLWCGCSPVNSAKYFTITFLQNTRRVTRGEKGEGRGIPSHFRKLEKMPWLWSYRGKLFSLIMEFLRVSRRKTRRFFFAGSFFLVFYRWMFIKEKLPCPKAFLATLLSNATQVLLERFWTMASVSKLIICRGKIDQKSKVSSYFHFLYLCFGSLLLSLSLLSKNKFSNEVLGN